VTRDETAARLRDILAGTLGSAVSDLDTDLVQSGLLDSLALVELLVAVEQEFSITFAPDELEIERFRSVRTLAELVDSHRSRA
jgi:methoxymalonate biosynthesis acyl carrier protein